MTSTSTFPGMDSDAKPSSRVLNPPGGASSNIFGGYDERPQQPRKKASEPTRIEEQSSEVSSSVDNSEPSQKNGTQDESPKPADTKPETDSPRDAQSSYKKRDSTHNPINWSPVKTASNDVVDDDGDSYKPSKRYYGQEKDSTHNPINWSASAAASDESSSDADRFKPSKRYYSQEKGVLSSKGLNKPCSAGRVGLGNQCFRECKFHCPTPFRPDNFGPGPCCQQPVFSYQIAEIGESYNPITGEMIGSGDTKPVHTSTKVHHPPGGKSTALW